MPKATNLLEKTKYPVIFATKIALILYTMMISVPLFHNWLYEGKKLFGIWTVLLAFLLIATDFKHFKTKEYVAMFLFCCSYGVTILLNRVHFVNEILILVFIISSYFMQTYCERTVPMEKVKKELRVIGCTVAGMTFAFSLVNLILFFLKYQNIGWLMREEYLSHMSASQLGGLYNPNTGGTYNYISILVSFMLLKESKMGGKVFLTLNAILQFFCFSLVQSRGSWVAFLTFVILYFVCVWRNPSFSAAKNALYKAVLLVCCVCLLIGGSKLSRKGLSYAAQELSSVHENAAPTEDYPDDTTSEIHTDTPTENSAEAPTISVNRNYAHGEQTDITSGRISIWKIGLDAFKDSPVLGIGYRSIDDAMKSQLSENGYSNSGAGGMHNVYITVLVSSGIVGFLLFAVLIVFLLLKVLKIYLNKQMPLYVKTLATFIPAWLVGELVESRIFLSFTNMSVFFWITAGYVMYYARECDKK